MNNVHLVTSRSWNGTCNPKTLLSAPRIRGAVRVNPICKNYRFGPTVRDGGTYVYVLHVYLHVYVWLRTEDLKVTNPNLSGRGAARAEDAQGTPTQSHISPSMLVYEDNRQTAPRTHMECTTITSHPQLTCFAIPKAESASSRKKRKL